MGNHNIPRDRVMNGNPESFVINDPEIGKTFAVRELTDAQLQRFMENCMQQQKVIVQQILLLMGQASQAAAMGSVLGYEADRRQRSVTIATAADLSSLRRQ